MKRKFQALLVLISTIFLVSCIEIQLSEVERLELLGLDLPGVINISDEDISLDSVSLQVYIQDEDEPRVLNLTSDDVVLTGTGYDRVNNTLKTDEVKTYTLRVSYDNVSITVTYQVYPDTVLGVGPLDEYTDLQEAIDDAIGMEEDGYTIQLTADYLTTTGLIIPFNEHMITLDLAGYTISYVSEIEESSQLLHNHGRLTINDTSENKTGKMTTLALYPDTSEVPSYGSSTILNEGILVVNGGTIENTSRALSGFAFYAIDNRSGTRNASVTINDGHLYNYATNAIRMYCLSETHNNTVTIHGGVVEGYGVIWMQNQVGSQNNGALTINGGLFKTTAKDVVAGDKRVYEGPSMMYDYPSSSNFSITINDGEFYENIASYGATAKITGGLFHGYVYLANGEITGGTFTVDWHLDSAVDTDSHSVSTDDNGYYVVLPV